MNRIFPLGALLASLTLLASSANAIQITSGLTSLGGNQYRYTYTVENDGSTGAAVELFDIFFDPALYDESSLAITTSDPPASDWDELILASGILLPAAYDVFALAGGIPIFGSESGFAIDFVWLGTDAPGTQPFSIYDPLTFELLESGITSFDSPSIPEPSPIILVMTAFLMLPLMKKWARG